MRASPDKNSNVKNRYIRNNNGQTQMSQEQ